jgi:hypothetical protein
MFSQNTMLAQGQTQGSTLNNTPTKPRLPALSTTPMKQEKSHPRYKQGGYKMQVSITRLGHEPVIIALRAEYSVNA